MLVCCDGVMSGMLARDTGSKVRLAEEVGCYSAVCCLVYQAVHKIC